MKPFKLCILVGRFQIIHKGHETMLDTALKLSERVCVFIGSANEERTNKNPFSYPERKEMLTTLYGDKIEIYPLNDIGVGNNSKWGEYVLENVKAACGCLPDLFVSGKEERRASWFDGEAGKHIFEVFVPKVIEISSSELRENLINGDISFFKKHTNEKLWEKYENLRKTVSNCKNVTETKSI